MIGKYENNSITVLTSIFFINAVLEISAEYFQFKWIIYVTKPLIPIILMVLYWVSSDVKNNLFFLTLFFSAITNLLFIPKNEMFLFYGILAFTIHRIILLYYVYKTVKVRSYKLFVLCTIPLLTIFIYLLIESSYLPANSIPILILQIFLIGIFGGIAVSEYILEDSKQSSYLMICALLFIALQLVIFIEKYFLKSIPIEALRPIAMSLNVLAFYSFYKFIISSEEKTLNND